MRHIDGNPVGGELWPLRPHNPLVGLHVELVDLVVFDDEGVLVVDDGKVVPADDIGGERWAQGPGAGVQVKNSGYLRVGRKQYLRNSTIRVGADLAHFDTYP